MVNDMNIDKHLEKIRRDGVRYREKNLSGVEELESLARKIASERQTVRGGCGQP